MRRHRKLVVRLLLALVVVCIGLGGFRIGRGFETEFETEFPESWEQDIPATGRPFTGYLESPPEGFRYETEGVLEGYLVFGLSTPKGPVAIKVDTSGAVVWAYRFDSKEGLLTDTRQLPDGNFLVQYSRNGVYEISPEGEVVWYYLDGQNSHHAQRLDNGNTIICQTERSRAYEISGVLKKVVWEWDARYEILDYGLNTFIGYPDIRKQDPVSSAYATYREMAHERKDWCHINTAFRTEEGTTLLCLRNLDLILEVDSDNNVVWSFGPLVLKHPHTCTRLENGNTLIFDNGNGRVIEVTPDHKIVWEYSGLYSPIMGGCQRLPNGNTLICESNKGNILVVNPEGDIVWKMTIPKDNSAWGLRSRKTAGVYRVWWYPE